ncbi:DUF6712 family protein [Parabacteroides goldsteinii]|uniref:DUF6712 family protein n=1 Tax=Parabacteroides goldsteinii TaxID=328812 RepID=UPI003AB8D9AD
MEKITMMILSNYEEFMKFIPTTFDANQDVNLFSEWIDIAEQTASQDLFGEDLYNHICNLPDSDNFRILCKRYICHLTLFEAIPNLDLILTNNGFAVVGGSNSQYVPASKDRVTALRLQEDVWREKFKENIIRRLSIDQDLHTLWKTNPALPGITDHLFVGYSDFRTFVPADDMKDPEIYRQTHARTFKFLPEYIYSYISPEYYAELLSKQYSSVPDTPDYTILHAVKCTIGTLIRSNTPSGSDINAATKTMEAAVNAMCLQLDLYPTYSGSNEYAIKTAVQYENKKEHATYFGGI